MSRIQEVKPAVRARFMKGERLRAGTPVYIGVGDEAMVCLTTKKGKSRFEAIGKFVQGEDGHLAIELNERAQDALKAMG